MKAVTLSTDGEILLVDSPAGMSSLDFLQKAVGGLIQPIDIQNNLTLWVNEEGKFNGCEYNPIATALWLKVFNDRDQIMGNVIFTGGTSTDGKTLGISKSVSDKLITFLELAKLTNEIALR